MRGKGVSEGGWRNGTITDVAAALLPRPADKQPAATKPTQQSLDLEDDSSPLAALIRLGVLPKKAEALLTNLQLGQDIEGELEYLDYCIHHAQSGKIRNPAGFCIRFIESNNPIPANFLTRSQREQQEEEYQAKPAKEARLAELQVTYDEYLSAEVERYILAMCPADYGQRVAIESADLAQRFKSVSPKRLREIADKAVRAKLRREVSIIPFEKFPQQEERHS